MKRYLLYGIAIAAICSVILFECGKSVNAQQIGIGYQPTSLGGSSDLRSTQTFSGLGTAGLVTSNTVTTSAGDMILVCVYDEILWSTQPSFISLRIQKNSGSATVVTPHGTSNSSLDLVTTGTASTTRGTLCSYFLTTVDGNVVFASNTSIAGGTGISHNIHKIFGKFLVQYP